MWHTVNNSTVTGGGKGVVILWRNGAGTGEDGERDCRVGRLLAMTNGARDPLRLGGPGSRADSTPTPPCHPGTAVSGVHYLCLIERSEIILNNPGGLFRGYLWFVGTTN